MFQRYSCTDKATFGAGPKKKSNVKKVRKKFLTKKRANLTYKFFFDINIALLNYLSVSGCNIQFIPKYLVLLL
jgi:hypothetical protein